MSQAAATTAAPIRGKRKPLRDIRGFWRVLLAVIAPLPMAANAVYYLLIPADQDLTFRQTVAAYAAHRSLVSGLRWFDAAFMVTLIPAVVAVAWVTRRRAPRMTTAGLVLAGLGLLTGLTLIGGPNTPALLTVEHNLDINTMSGLYNIIGSDPITLIASVLFLAGIVFGLGFLGAALWRSRVAPAWMGIALMIGGITHPVLPGHVAQGAGLIVATAGFTGATLALLRLSNDDFDLPPAAPEPQLS
jgi:hypothetical protein